MAEEKYQGAVRKETKTIANVKEAYLWEYLRDIS